MKINNYSVGYFPTLAIRPAEMRALEELPEKSKDRICPVILLCPWSTANTLESASERLIKAFGKSRPFFLDIDPHYVNETSDRDAVLRFNDMRLGNDNWESYYKFVENVPNALPVLQIKGANKASVSQQLDNILELDRDVFLVRITPNTRLKDYSILSPIFDAGIQNFIVALDGEWTKDVISTQRFVAETINQIDGLNPSNVRYNIITSVSTFPKGFTDIEGKREIPVDAVLLHQNIKQRYENRYDIHYGDWATTKPKEYRGGRGDIPARIDYVLKTQWIIYRKQDEWDYKEAAEHLMNDSSVWQDDLAVWGSLQIEKTAVGDPSGINSPQRNVAARVNLHLHQFAWNNDPDQYNDADDIWSEDDF